MIQRISAALLLLLLATASAADEKAKTGHAAVAEAAARVRAAAEDEARLKTLAAVFQPDPWLVADELLATGHGDVAARFAAACEGKDTERLPAYVSAHRERPFDAAARRAVFDAFAAIRAEEPQRVTAALAGAKGDPGPVLAAMADFARGVALQAAKEHEQAMAAFARAADAMEALGWLRRAAGAVEERGRSAFAMSDLRAAHAAYRRGVKLEEARERPKGVAGFLGNVAMVLGAAGQMKQAVTELERAGTIQREIGDEEGTAMTLLRLGRMYWKLGRRDEALTTQRQALAYFERVGNDLRSGAVLVGMGITHWSMGDYPEAQASYERARTHLEKIGHTDGLMAVRGNLGLVHKALGDFPRALQELEIVLRHEERGRDARKIARALGNVANVDYLQGNHTKALALHRRCLELYERLGVRDQIATTLGNLGLVYDALGRFPEALDAQTHALEMARAIDARADVARHLGSLANLHHALGDLERALTLQREAIAAREGVGSKVEAAASLGNLGNILHDLGRYEEALASKEQAAALKRELNDRYGEALTWGDAAVTLEALGRLDEARRAYERALALKREMGNRDGAAITAGNLGYLRWTLGERKEGLAQLDEAAREAERVRALPTQVSCLLRLAKLQGAGGDAAAALATATRALRVLEDLLGGLDEENAASLRSTYADLFEVGVKAAAQLGREADVLLFAESGRAGALLESLDGRQALRWTDLPAELRAAEAEAKARLARARWEQERAARTGRVPAARAALKRVDEALAKVREVGARIQRDAKRQAGLFYPRAETLAGVQAALGTGSALVVYAEAFDDVHALVVQPSSVELVRVGPKAEVVAACEALHLDRAGSDPATALAQGRKRLVAPLSLPSAVRTVIVSPFGALSYVPFGALLPERDVVCTPSATTHVLLRGEIHGDGEQVLALGDPVYTRDGAGTADQIYARGHRLLRLEQSGKEAVAVGDVALLREKATEAGLREALAARERWRAVHLACHGLLDVERPTLSSLALSRDGEDDGYLTALEVLRMEIPADLVVLSACDSARGTIYRGEGIIGLTRAFMYAGAPRVLASLWKVDDAATRALMEAFYELWNAQDGERLTAAAALRGAQALVRSQEKWKHPRYWAAWVLWGLP